MTEKNNHFSIASRITSFRYALAGLLTLLREQHNARLHALATLCVIAAGIYLSLGAIQWSLLTVAIALVWISEATNTAIEYLCDQSTTDFHPRIKKIKDVAAAAALISSIAAAAIGALIFIPEIVSLRLR